MELWIRSQDKECLIRVSNLQYVLKKETNFAITTEYHYIGTYYDNLKILGTYKTKERALEVLDEIQEKLKAGFVYDSRTSYSMNQTIFRNEIYKMPEE